MSRYYSPEGVFYNLDKTLNSEFYCLKLILGTKHNSLIYLVSLWLFVL